MKKILTALAYASILTIGVSADMARLEMGAGAWIQKPSGDMSYSAFGGISGVDNSTKKEETTPYVWVLIKHPIPIVPNFRLEYADVTNIGTATGTFKNFTIPITSKTTLNLTQYDVIPYYNLLDNLAWTTLDLGIDLKVIDASYVAEGVNIPFIGGLTNYEDEESIILPMLYVRARVEIPSTDIGIETDIKYVTYGANTAYDIRAKIDYTFDIDFLLDPAIEVGYRTQRFKLDDDSIADVKIDLDFSGVYAGIFIRY